MYEQIAVKAAKIPQRIRFTVFEYDVLISTILLKFLRSKVCLSFHRYTKPSVLRYHQYQELVRGDHQAPQMDLFCKPLYIRLWFYPEQDSFLYMH